MEKMANKKKGKTSPPGTVKQEDTTTNAAVESLSPSTEQTQIQSPTLDYYYGAAPAAGAALSPKLTTEGIETAPNKKNKTSTIADASHMVARAVSSVARKVTSVRLDLGNASGTGGDGGSDSLTKDNNEIQDSNSDSKSTFQEGADVSAERTRVENLWQQWSLQQNSS